MQAVGMLFVNRTPVCLSQDTRGQDTLTIGCVDRIGPHAVEGWRLVWKGPAAADFYRAHRARLTAGTPIVATVSNLRAHAVGRITEITAKVHMLTFAEAPKP